MSEPPPGEPLLCRPPGHFHSPIVDPDALAARAESIWPTDPEVLAIDFRPSEHRRILREVFPRFIADYDYAELQSETATEAEYFTNNGQFGWLDSRALFVLLRDLPPRRMIEVGSGFSSLLTANINRRWFNGEIEVDCIDPYPRPFLEGDVPGIGQLIRERVEHLDLAFFARLEAGDVLFIDSSHVAKTGSDVIFLLFEVLPRLKAGVRVHLHDIFLPHDYPKDWVLGENRSWNEQYVLRALLMYSTAFRVVFGSSYAFTRFPDLVASALGVPPGEGFGGGSFWIEKV